VAEKNVELARFFEAYDQAQLDLSPQSKTFRGIKDEDYGRWSDFTDEAALAQRNLDVTTLANLRSRFDRAPALARRPAQLRPVREHGRTAAARSSRTATTATSSTR
jgi:hypothetical protein